MKIAFISPLEESVPPEKYGGVELVIFNLVEALVDRGHEIFLLGTGDSKTKAHLIPVFSEAIRKDKQFLDPEFKQAAKFVGVGRVLDELAKLDVDIVHNHIGWRLIPFSKHIKAPIVTTLHGPLEKAQQQYIYGLYSDLPYVSISNAQREPFKKLNFVATIYNGIDPDKFDFIDVAGEYLAFLGRMSPEKGPKVAISVAKKIGLKLKMAAKIDAVDKEYFEKEIKPLIDGKQIEYLGEIGAEEKNNLLKKAYALLVPIQWEEPFGLVMIEAMACGTPVIAFRRGSVPEIVVDGQTGFIVKNEPEMIKAIKRIGSIKREKCRARVEENFTTKLMADKYEKVYQKLI